MQLLNFNNKDVVYVQISILNKHTVQLIYLIKILAHKFRQPPLNSGLFCVSRRAR